MMNYVWTALIALSFFAALAKGNITELSAALVNGGAGAVELTLKLMGVIAFWSGMMNIAESSGLTKLLCRALLPVLKIIFPKLDKNSPATSAISMNITANLLGLGSAATPLGLEAMARLKESSSQGDTATNDMIKFVVINSAAIHLIPTTVAMMRSEAGSTSPMDIMLPALLTSVAALTTAVTLAKIIEAVQKRRMKHGNKA